VALAVAVYLVFVVFDPLSRLEQERDIKRKSDLAAVQNALENFYHDNRVYPESQENNIKRLDDTVAFWGENWLPYMQILPKDESDNRTYVYAVSDSRQSYYLYASLEREDDKDLCAKDGPCVSAITNGVEKSCGGICNYGVSSPNTSP
jgi:hypothetical protein